MTAPSVLAAPQDGGLKTRKGTLKTMAKMLSIRWISSTLVGVAVMALVGCGLGAREVDPINKIVIIVDASVSYARRLQEALTRATRLVENIATTKTNRWDTSLDQVTIVALDAMPSVLWSGDLAQLKTLEPDFWKERLKGRSDYNRCTDVPAAFRLAAKSLDGDPRVVSKYIFAFTDLINEPPTNDVKTCAPPRLPSGPSEDFPWESLSDASVSTYWLPPNQALVWRRAAEERRLSDSFAFYSLSESASAPIPAPPRPQVKTTVAEQEQQRRRIIDGSWSVARTAGMLGVAGVGLMFGLAWVASRRRRRPRNGRGAVAFPGTRSPGARPQPGVNRRAS